LRTDKKSRLRGEVVSADERSVTVKTDAESVDIPYDAIVRGNLIVEVGER
jgi:ribosome maturation factor RimP